MEKAVSNSALDELRFDRGRYERTCGKNLQFILKVQWVRKLAAGYKLFRF